MDREFLEKRKKDLNAYLQVSSCRLFCVPGWNSFFFFSEVENLLACFFFKKSYDLGGIQSQHTVRTSYYLISFLFFSTILAYFQTVLSPVLWAGEVSAVLVLSSTPLNILLLRSCLWLLALVLLHKDWCGTCSGSIAQPHSFSIQIRPVSPQLKEFTCPS